MAKGEGNGALQRVLRQQAALAAFGVYAFREPDLQKILTEAAKLCAEGMDVPYCKVCKYRPEHNDLLVQAGVGWKPSVIGYAVSEAKENSPIGRAYLTGEPVITRDVQQARDFVLPPIYADHGIVSSVNVVIAGSSGPYGVLEIDSPELCEFDCHDVNSLQTFANVLAEAVAIAGQIEALRATIAQRDVLARELQHRVRNNLQVIYHLLTKQLRETDDEKAKRGFSDVARRVMTLGHVYEHLLGVGMTERIDLGKYLESLCAGLGQFYEGERPKVQLRPNIASLSLDLDTSTALGIIVTELISNSYEHAFCNAEPGTIGIELRRDGERAILVIDDSGPGLAESTDPRRLGLDLMHRLVQQIRGTVELADGKGTKWMITLPIPETRAAR